MNILNESKRSYNMSQIKSKDTKPEIILRKYLHGQGIRFRLHGKYKKEILPGKPDVVLAKYKSVINVNGCFWHGHKGCKYYRLPKTNVDFWKWKISRNKANDILNTHKLNEIGWNVITIWECDLKDKREETLKNLLLLLSEIKPKTN
ncbi:DNA mismatch endonuclease Vsr [Flammeovirga yaeyamensis]|uniref:Very short patch repair endonuclease n=1 Tax=Flammeovirga yaeyamensis TaxID=367791 RepID=A0AAX1N3Q0_9BACT|nr:DNA mismatch endonuclease Vsr [Flammeovirga yaeyamensis]MBB3695934.1 DNA mismatch endonuclease (patch repair protein) [Flammeovirga yaeyamensis]QWG00548.1 DNA mismatch endonuclease Vsr [Flammeovirga yaeyamensis]